LSPVRVSGQFLHSWYRELLSPRLGRRSSSREMSLYMDATSIKVVFNVILRASSIYVSYYSTTAISTV
ncbi:hypothetical protein T03_6919, partial [Trichinella britovi]